MTTFSSERDIERIAFGLLDRTLPKSEWTHAAHFAAALWLLRHRPGLVWRGDVAGLIRAYNEATGTANTDHGGYHETITVASLRATSAFLARSGSESPLHRIANALMASPLGRSDWLLEYWTRPRLFSVAARREWREPDIKPLPYGRLVGR